MKKIDKNYIWLCLISVALVCIIIPMGSLFGSLVDWLPQHVVFPDYFRKLFYETGNLFPNFAAALGAGQNIFNFSYYGLFNPIILISYLLPFIDMTTYLIGANIVLYVSTGLLGYMFLKRHFSTKVSFISTILLLLAAPLLFHFHRHFMFVSYMPFLFIGLMSIESYFEKGNKWALALSTFLIILISYYYSIPSILVFVLYGIYVYMKYTKKMTVKKFIIDGFCFILPIIVGVMMAGLLLLPTFYTLIEGRSAGGATSLLSLFIPDFDFSNILYGNYAIGLTALAIVSLFYSFLSHKREDKFLSISIFVILLFPIFSYLLNGTLYIRDKVFIPFLPLFIYFIASFLEDLMHKKIPKYFSIAVIVCILWCAIWGLSYYPFYLDIAIVLLFTYFYQKKKWSSNSLWFLVLPSLILFFGINYNESYVSKKLYDDSIKVNKNLEKELKSEADFVRTYHLEESLYNVNKIYMNGYYTDSVYSSIYNNEYRNFYKDTFKNPLSYRNKLITASNNNLFYQMFMGGKYMYAKSGMQGYEKIEDNLYQNKDVLPVFYVTDHIISEKDFAQLKYPYTAETLLKNTVVGNQTKNVIDTSLTEEVLSGEVTNKKGLQVEKKEDFYHINAKKKNQLTFHLDNSLQDKILLLEFSIGKEWSCKNGDAKITINNVSNTLTCQSWIYKNENKVFHFVLSDQNIKDLKVTFAKGNYKIGNIKLYTTSYQDIKDIKNNVVPAKRVKNKTFGDQFTVEVKNEKAGYFVTSIPYDKGFHIYDNGKEISYTKVNTAFIGFSIKEGTHQITMKYSSPLFKEGKYVSIIGFLCFGILVYQSKRGYKRNKKNI
ncbi:MAG: YfhO family protein [Bacilli bacterium]|nr:YfhO family protein [Bacilli bacterium]